MAIKATAMEEARIPMPSIELQLIIAGEERNETLRLNRRIVSPETRRQAKEQYDQTAPDREEIVRILVFFDVQCPDILGADDKPYPLTSEYLSTRDDSLLYAIWTSLQDSFIPKAKTSDAMNSGS